MRALRRAFPAASEMSPEKALAEFARQRLLIVDSIPFAMKYSSSKRRGRKYEHLVSLTVPALLEKLESRSFSWSPDLRIAFSVRLNALAVISGLDSKLSLGGRTFPLSSDLIAVNGAGYPDGRKLRALFGGAE
jgi:hypothetical protein